ncbi:MAG: DUF1877 family protein [Leptolyngbya sp. BL-A-14]
MGIDMTYQAMPECPLLERSRQEPEFGSLLEFFSSIARNGAITSEQPWLSFAEAAQQTIQQYPGLDSRYLAWGRCWDTIHYLLSEQRRQDYSHPDPSPHLSPLEKAIFGSTILHPQVKTTIGFRISYTLPDDVVAIADFLAGITPALLHQHFDPVVMREHSVYKIRGDEDESEFTWIQEDFEKLSTFYQHVAAHNEGVLGCLG